MAKRRKAKTKTIVRYRTRKNPKRARRAARAVGRTIAGVNVWGALKNVVPMALGALAAKFVAKRFAEGGGELETWDFKNIGFALLGGLTAAVGTRVLFKGKSQTAQRVAEGAFLLVAYKLITNKLAPQNESLEAWFGAEEDYIHPDYLGESRIQPVDPTMGALLELPDGGTYVRDNQGNWMDTDENSRVAGRLQPVDPTMGAVSINDFNKAYPTM